MNTSKRNHLRGLSPLIILLTMLICVISCGNKQPEQTPLAPSQAAGSGAPAGYETFDEPRIFARYSNKINGYDVKVMILPAYRTWRGSCRAIINFSNKDGNYKIVDDGWRDSLYYDEETETVKMPDASEVVLTYKKPVVPTKEAFRMEQFGEMPFVFYDLDFDGKDELLVKLASQGQRWSNAYDVVEMEPDRLYSIYRKPPFTELDDLTIINPLEQTITLNAYEGHGEEWHTVYKVSTDETYGMQRVTKEYVDNLLTWGLDDDTTPVYRRIYPRGEMNDTTGWMPIK